MQNPLRSDPVKSISDLSLALFESNPDCIKLLDSTGRILAMNRNGLCAMEIDDFGAIFEMPWTSLLPEENHVAVEAATTAARSGESARLNIFCPTAKGTPKWWEVVITPVRAESGSIDTLLAVSRDITASHYADAELRASEARFRSLVTATSAIVWTTPASGQFETAQAGWAAFTGQSHEEYLGSGWLAMVHPDDQARTVEAWRTALQAKSIYAVEQRLRRFDGQYRHMSVRGVPVINAAGQVHEWVGIHTDITASVAATSERERLLREVQAANDRLADVFRQAPAFMCILRGPQHRFEMINQRYLQLVGNRDLVGQTVRQALPEIEGQGFFELIDTAYQTGETFVGVDMPVMLNRSSGEPLEQRFVDFVYLPLRDADGQVTGLLAHGVDQTERKKAELDLYASRERLQQILSQAATGVVQSDVDGRINLVNQKYCEMLGYSEAEILGKTMMDLTAPGSLADTTDKLQLVAAGAPGFVIDKEYARKDGTLMPATSSVNALRGQNGEFMGLVAIVLDNTERKRAVEELRDSEQRYRTLFESMDQGFCVLEMIFDETGSAVDFMHLETNPVHQDHTGLSKVVGKLASEAVPGLPPFWFATLGRVAQTGEAVRFESEALGRWFDVHATRIGGEGSRKVALLFRDVSARRQADEDLRHLAAELAEADRRKTEFLATLAHELRNPLAPIRSGLGVMRLSGDNPATVIKVREMMERQVNHMVRLVDDLLDVARISGGKLELKQEQAELKNVLASAVETSLPLIEAGQHELEVDVPPQDLPVEVDVTRMAQVVSNLLNNAAKYTPAGGRILLSAQRENGEAVISIRDTGVGIPAESLTTVFDMFAQVGRNLERSQGGLGIGLSLVRRLVEMHGGKVQAESAGPGQGSTFTVRLPLRKQGTGSGRTSLAQAGPGLATAGGVKVVVVDDNVDAALTLSMILDASGHSAQVAHGGEAALDLIARFQPEAVFLDIGMPGMNGYETARAIRRMPGLEHIVLVALTGWGAEDDRLRSKEAGFDHHLTKPVELDTVHRLLSDLASESRPAAGRLRLVQ